MIQEFVNRKELNRGINPDETVAYGAAVQEGIVRGNAETFKLSEKLKLDAPITTEVIPDLLERALANLMTYQVRNRLPTGMDGPEGSKAVSSKEKAAEASGETGIPLNASSCIETSGETGIPLNASLCINLELSGGTDGAGATGIPRAPELGSEAGATGIPQTSDLIPPILQKSRTIRKTSKMKRRGRTGRTQQSHTIPATSA